MVQVGSDLMDHHNGFGCMGLVVSVHDTFFTSAAGATRVNTGVACCQNKETRYSGRLLGISSINLVVVSGKQLCYRP